MANITDNIVADLVDKFKRDYKIITGFDVFVRPIRSGDAIIQLVRLEELINLYIPEHLQRRFPRINRKHRKREISDLRKIFSYIAHYDFGYSYASVGRYFNQDHTTILNNCQKAAYFIENDAEFRDLYNTILNTVTHDVQRSYADSQRRVNTEPGILVTEL